MSLPDPHASGPVASTLSRRTWMSMSAAAVLTALTTRTLAQSKAKVPDAIRYALIGEGKSEPGTVLRYGIGGVDLARELGSAKVDWRSGFPASLPVVEAMRGGAIDFSFATSTALIYAVGGKVPVVPLACYPLPSNECDLLVHADSPIQSLRDLKGKRVADHRGTTGTYSLVKTLEAAGLKLSDIQYVNLTAPDAEAAFANKRVDAWISWQPMIELARRRYSARTLPDVKTYDYAFFVAREQFANEYPETVAKLVRMVRDAQRLIEARPDETVARFEELGAFGGKQLERDVYLDLVKSRRLSFSGAGQMNLVDAASATAVQELADSFHELKIYPERIAIKDWLLDKRHAKVRDAIAAEFQSNA